MKNFEQHREAAQMPKKVTGEKSYAQIAAEGGPKSNKSTAVAVNTNNKVIAPRRPADAWVTVTASCRAPKRAYTDVDDYAEPMFQQTRQDEQDEWAAPMDTTTFAGGIDESDTEPLEELEDSQVSRGSAKAESNETKHTPTAVDPAMLRLQQLVQQSEKEKEKMAANVTSLQQWQQEMDQKFSLLQSAAENTQLQMTQLHQAQVETQRVMKDQNEGIMKFLESLQQQVSAIAAKKEDDEF